MASQSNNILTTSFIILILVVLFTGLYYSTIDIDNNNDKLDSDSEDIIDYLGVYYNNISDTSFISTSGQYNDSSFDDVDPYIRQYLEDKTEIQQKQSILNKVVSYPSIILRVFGVSDSTILIAFNSLIYGFITFIIGLQIYKAIKGDVD
jgi:hypothetical protein